MIRVIVPDSHGEHIDLAARDAFLADLKRLSPQEIVCLGDHLDCGGTFSQHQRNYTNELCESYEADCSAGNQFFDLMHKAAPGTKDWDYLEGNHEAHIQRWAARTFQSYKDAEFVVERIGPQKALNLKERGIRYFKSSVQYQGFSIPGTIRRGKCFFTHGISHSRHAAVTHLAKFGEPVVFGHVHRSMAVIESTVTKAAIGAWCPGTLAKLQPLYKHTAPSGWTHGYGVQFVNRSGRFVHVNVPIVRGESLLLTLAKAVG